MSVFQIVLLSIFGASAVAAVLIFAILTSTNTGPAIGQVTIWGTFDESTFQAVLRSLGENDSRLKTVTYVQKREDTYEKELTDALAAGTGPDLFFIRQDYAYVNAPKIAAIPFEQFSRQQFVDLFVEGANPFLSPEGVLAVPVIADPLVLYWNRDMLASAGFSKPPVYWNELFDMARIVTKRTDAGSIRASTIAFGEYANVSHAKQILSMLIMQAGGPVTRRDGTGQLTASLVARTGAVVRPAESAIQFFTDFANPSKDYYSWNRSLPQSRSMFGSGDLALYFGPASEELLIRRLNPNLNFGVAPVPQIKNVDADVNAGYVYGLAIPKATQNLSGALTTAFLIGSQEASKVVAEALGYVSARRDVLANPEQDVREIFRRQAILLRAWEDPNPTETEEIFKDMIESVTSGALKPSEAVQRADEAMRTLVAP